MIGTDSALREDVVLVGLGTHANWYRKLLAHPAIEIAIGRDRFRPGYSVLPEREDTPVFADFDIRNRLSAPVISRVLSWLVGWDYDGSDEADVWCMSVRVAFGPRPESTDRLGCINSGAGRAR